jgi:fibronectin type 3 domain-containing protein
VDTDVANGTTYYYQVRSATGVVKGPLTPTVQSTPTAPPAVPTGLTATPGHATISLNWNLSAGARVYLVKRAASPGGPYETVAHPEAPPWDDIGLTNGTPYYYRLRAENAGGISSDSAEIVASPVAPPAVPTGLQSSPASGEVSLSWNPVPGATQYKVKRGLTPEGPFVAIAQPGEPAYTDTGLINGTTYHYVVSALNIHGECLDSFPTLATPVGVPTTPSGLRATAGNAKIDLAWNGVPYATRYRVMRSATTGGPYLLVASPRDPVYSDTPLTNGLPQYYVVSAVNAGGESPGSAEITSTPMSGAPPDSTTQLLRATAENVPTLESIPMPAGKKMQGIDLERLLDLRRVEQLRMLFEGTAQKFEEWEVLTLISEEGYETRKTMELVLRLKNQGNQEAYTTGAMELFDKIVRIRAEHAPFVKRLRAFLDDLDVKSPSPKTMEIAMGFILQAARGRQRAEKWVDDPAPHRKAASEYMKMAYAIAQKYQAAL